METNLKRLFEPRFERLEKYFEGFEIEDLKCVSSDELISDAISIDNPLMRVFVSLALLPFLRDSHQSDDDEEEKKVEEIDDEEKAEEERKKECVHESLGNSFRNFSLEKAFFNYFIILFLLVCFFHLLFCRSTFTF